ncbi:hypothetical protein ABPG72_006932 [Tetrahymena utriculariae]
MINTFFNSLPPVKDNYHYSHSKSINNSNSKQLSKTNKNSSNISRSDQDSVIQSPVSRNNDVFFQSFSSSQRSFFSSLQQSYSGLSKNNDNSMGSFQDQYTQSFATERQKRVIKIQKIQEQKNKNLLNFSQLSQEESEFTYEKINIVNRVGDSLRLGSLFTKTKSDTIFQPSQEITQTFNQKQQEQHIDLIENSKQTIEIPSKKYIYARISILNQHLPLRFSCESDKEDYQIYFSFYDQYPNQNNTITIPTKRKSHLYKVGNETIQTKYFYFSFYSEIKVLVSLKVWFTEKILESFRQTKQCQIGLKAQQKEFQRQFMKKIMEEKKFEIQEKERIQFMMLEQIREEKFQGQEVEESILRFYLNCKNHLITQFIRIINQHFCKEQLKEQQRQEYIEKNKLVIQNTQVKGMWENREKKQEIFQQHRKKLEEAKQRYQFIQNLNYKNKVQNIVQKQIQKQITLDQVKQQIKEKKAQEFCLKWLQILNLIKFMNQIIHKVKYKKMLQMFSTRNKQISQKVKKQHQLALQGQPESFHLRMLTNIKGRLMMVKILFEKGLERLKQQQYQSKKLIRGNQVKSKIDFSLLQFIIYLKQSAKNGICKEYIYRQLRDLKMRIREARDQKQSFQSSLRLLYLVKERQQLMDILLYELEALKERYGSDQQSRKA